MAEFFWKWVNGKLCSSKCIYKWSCTTFRIVSIGILIQLNVQNSVIEMKFVFLCCALVIALVCKISDSKGNFLFFVIHLPKFFFPQFDLLAFSDIRKPIKIFLRRWFITGQSWWIRIHVNGTVTTKAKSEKFKTWSTSDIWSDRKYSGYIPFIDQRWYETTYEKQRQWSVIITIFFQQYPLITIFQVEKLHFWKNFIFSLFPCCFVQF